MIPKAMRLYPYSIEERYTAAVTLQRIDRIRYLALLVPWVAAVIGSLFEPATAFVFIPTTINAILLNVVPLRPYYRKAKKILEADVYLSIDSDEWQPGAIMVLSPRKPPGEALEKKEVLN